MELTDMIATWDREQVVREGDLLANSAVYVSVSFCVGDLNTGAPETSRHESEHIPHHASTFMYNLYVVCVLSSSAMYFLSLNLLY